MALKLQILRFLTARGRMDDRRLGSENHELVVLVFSDTLIKAGRALALGFTYACIVARAALRSSALGLPLLLTAGTSLASPFVNTAEHPALTALRPVAWATPANAAAAPGREGAAPEATPTAAALPVLPELILSFAPASMGPQNLLVQHTDVWERIRAGFMLQELTSKEVMEMQAWYITRPQLVTSIFERSRAHLFHIVEEIEKRNMPMEIALLPFIESGFNPMAISSAQASGLWQFIPETGLRYHLAQSAAYDARRDVLASTTAALDYLQFLFDTFHDWHLALAAYNWGENAVARAIEHNRAKGLPTDYASLTVPQETRYYVPRLLAVKHIVSNPGLFGIALPQVPNEPYFTTVARRSGSTLKADVKVDIKGAARLADLGIDEFRALNAAHNSGVITVGATLLVVPLDKAQSFAERLEAYVDREEARIRAEAEKAAKRSPVRKKTQRF
jgi:membrane-bound lytic murein transglycosylase D